MKKILLYVLIFGLLIAGATVLYNRLGDEMKAQQEALKTPVPTETVKEAAPAPVVPTEAPEAAETETENATEAEKAEPVETPAPTESPYAPAPDFRMQNAAGEEVLLSEIAKGKPAVLNFWASWCGPCQEEMPEFEALNKEYAGEVEFIMVNVTGGRETLQNAKAFIEQTGYDLPFYFDVTLEGTYTYYVNSLPMSFFLNARGELVNAYFGRMDEAAIRQYIEEARNS